MLSIDTYIKNNLLKQQYNDLNKFIGRFAQNYNKNNSKNYSKLIIALKRWILRITRIR